MLLKQSPSFRIIEITGAPCSGKTTFLKSNFADAKVLKSLFPETASVFSKLIHSIKSIFKVLVTRQLTTQQLRWLIRKTLQYDASLISKLNAFRNCTLKFDNHFRMVEDSFVVVDEGISHIPFILEIQSPTEIDEFTALFRKHLAGVTILFVEAPADKEILFVRLCRRGHVRISSTDDINAFVDRNSRVAALYQEALQQANLTLIQVRCV
jgi:hypothetical protein